MWETIARDGFWCGRRVALTGATGFVGHHLALLLRRLGANVTALVRASSPTGRLQEAGVTCLVAPLDSPERVARAARGCEYFFHVAGAVNFDSEWARLVQTNVDGTRHVLEAARQANIRRLIFTSSIVAVGASPEPILRDESAPWSLGHLPIPYVHTKRQAEELALAASDQRLEVVAVNPACVLGPDDFRASEFGTLCQRFWRGRVPFYFGGGGSNFVDVRDVAAGQVLAARHGRPGQRYLLGGVNRTYAAFFTELARLAGRPIFRLRLPSCLAQPLALLDTMYQRRRRQKGRSTRPQLTLAQAALQGLYFFFTAHKAAAELGYQPRPFAQTLRDTHDFWQGLLPRSGRAA
jgi:dihydroflavonol-4-reductase